MRVEQTTAPALDTALPDRLLIRPAGYIGAQPEPGVAFVEIDRNEWPRAYLADTPSGAFDRLRAETVLAYVERPDEALANWLRVLRPGGQLDFTVPAQGDGTAHTWRFVMQDPAADVEGTLNMLELLQVVCHLAVVEQVVLVPAVAPADGGGAQAARQHIAVRLRKRPVTLTPVQSNNTAEVQLLSRLTMVAVSERTRWRSMQEFDQILASGVLERTVVDPSRLYLLYQWLLSTVRVPGDCIEVGSYRGGTAKLISEVLLRHNADADLHLFDTFAGMPEQLAIDEVGLQGAFADTSLEQVQTLLANNPRVRFYPGIFPSTILPELYARRFRFAHIDVDIESSVRDCLEFLYPRMSPGGIIIFDDYGHPQCPGATRAVERFFAGKPEMVVQMPLLSSAMVIRANGA